MATLTAGRTGINVKMIFTHMKPHLDEIVAIWMLLEHGGEKLFPGISEAELVFIDDSSNLDGEKLLNEEGTLCLGIGGGRFDEHGDDAEVECCATLVAQALGLRKDPRFKQILNYVHRIDTQGGSTPFELANIVKMMYGNHPEDPEMVVDCIKMILDAKFAEQSEFARAVEVVDSAECKAFKFGKHLVVACETDNEQFAKAARRKHPTAALVIQRTSDGNTQLYANQKRDVPLGIVARSVRMAEQRKTGHVVTTDQQILETQERVAGAECWYLYTSPESGKPVMFLNGSKSHKAEPTKLSRNEILDAVERALLLK